MTMLDSICVNLGCRSYKIYISSNTLNNNKIQKLFKNKKRNVLVTNYTLKKIILDNSNYNFSILKNVDKMIFLKDGECYKNLKEVERILTFLLKNSYGRDTTLIALGGGVIGDITGFAASIYLRGISFIQIPTTLLAQVDASIGGKTGVNHILGKNMIGSFWQPKSVIIDVNYILTLPLKQIISGIAEIIKYAIIFDKKFFYWLEKNLSFIIKKDIQTLLYCIKKCCEIKAKIVEFDETENSNHRILLNLGHSFAHAIETYTGYDQWLHGYAVSVGIVMSAYLANILNLLEYSCLSRIVSILYKIGLPIIGPIDMCPKNYINLMRCDKKNLNSKIRLVLPTSIGSACTYTLSDESKLILAITNCYKKNIFL